MSRLTGAALCSLAVLVIMQPLAAQAPPTSWGSPEQNALGLLPSLPPDPFARAASLMQERKNDEALSAINEALAADPKRGPAYGLRSGILGNLGQYEEGIADAELGITLSVKPRDKAMSAYNKCYCLTELKRRAEAIKACSLATRFDPSYGRAHFGAGKLYYQLQMWKEAGAALDKALVLNPKLAAAWAYRAEAHFFFNKDEQGLSAANKAVELGPNDRRSYRARAIGRERVGDYQGMLEDAERLLEIDSVRSHGHLLRGKALSYLGRHKEAFEAYQSEQDRDAVSDFLRPAYIKAFGTRIFNCGSGRMDYDTPGNATTSDLDGCLESIREAFSGESAPFGPMNKKLPKLIRFLPPIPAEN